MTSFSKAAELLIEERDHLLDVLARQGGIFLLMKERTGQPVEEVTRHKFFRLMDLEAWMDATADTSEGSLWITIISRTEYLAFDENATEKNLAAWCDRKGVRQLL